MLQPLEVALLGSHIRAPCGAPLQASPPRRGCAPHRVSCGDPFRRPASGTLSSRALDEAARPSPPAGILSRYPRVCARSRVSSALGPPSAPRAGAHRLEQPLRPTFVRQPLQAEREVPSPAPHPGGRPAARPGLASPARAPAPAPPPLGQEAQRSAGEGRGPGARRAWAAAEGWGVSGRPPGTRLSSRARG